MAVTEKESRLGANLKTPTGFFCQVMISLSSPSLSSTIAHRLEHVEMFLVGGGW